MNAASLRMDMVTVVDKLLRVWTGSWKSPNLPVSRKLQVERGERSQTQTQTLRQTGSGWNPSRPWLCTFLYLTGNPTAPAGIIDPHQQQT